MYYIYVKAVINVQLFFLRLRDDRLDVSEAKERMYYDVSRQKDNYVNGKDSCIKFCNLCLFIESFV